MATWDYRVLRNDDDPTDPFYQIYEVYYNDAAVPESCAENGAGLGSETAVGLALSLPAYLGALVLPVLSYADLSEVEPPVARQALAK